MVLQSIAQYIPIATASKASSAASERPASSSAPGHVLRVDDQATPNQVTLYMAPFTTDSVAGAVGRSRGVVLLASYPTIGAYIFGIPQLQVDQVDATNANVSFPTLMSQDDIKSYLDSNRLTVSSWQPAFEGSYTVAAVTLPQIIPQLVDPYRGIWKANLPLHMDAKRLAAWAAGNGVTVSSYDPETGDVLLLGPAAPPVSTRTQRIVPRTTIVSQTPTVQVTTHRPGNQTTPVTLTSPPPPTTSANPPPTTHLFARFAPGATQAMVDALVRQAGGSLTSYDATTRIAVIAVGADRQASLRTLLSASTQVTCVGADAGTCAAPPTSALTAPMGVAITPGTTSLRWQPVVGASAYAIFRSPLATGGFAFVGRVAAGPAQPVFIDHTAPTTGTVYYRVMPLQACGAPGPTTCDVAAPIMDPAYSSAAVAAVLAPAPPTTTGSGGGTPNPVPTPVPTPAPTTDGGTTTIPVPTPIGAGAPPAAAGIAAAAHDGHVTLSWAPVAGATDYSVERVEGGVATVIATTTSTSLVDVGGQTGTTYTYRVRATTTAPTATAPQATSATWAAATSAPLLLSLTPVAPSLSGTVAFRAVVRTGDGGGSVAWSVSGPLGSAAIGSAAALASANDPLTWIAARSWDSSGLSDGSYTLHLALADRSGHSTTTDLPVKIANAAPMSPTHLGAATLASGVALTWDQPAESRAAAYRVLRDGVETAMLPAAAQSWVDSAAATGSHAYSVVLLDATGRQSAPAQVTVTVAAAPVPSVEAPVLRAVLPSGRALAPDGLAEGSLILRVDSAAGLAHFEYAADGTGWSTVPAGVTCTPGCGAEWSLAGLADGHYQLRAVTPAGAHSQPLGFSTASHARPAAPLGPLTAVAPEGVLISWGDAGRTATTTYQVSRKVGTSWSVLDRVSGDRYLDATPDAGSRATYRVQVLSDEGVAGTPSVESFVDIPRVTWAAPATLLAVEAPHGLRALSGLAGVTLDWRPVPSANGYRVQRAWQATGPFNTVGETGATLFRDQAQLGGVAYYRVRALSGGRPGPLSDVVSALVLPAAASATPGDFVLAAAAPVAAPATSLSLGTAAVAARAGSRLEVIATGTASASVTEVDMQVKAAQAGSSWHTVAILPLSSTAGQWTATGDVVTAALPAGTYSVRAAALAADGSTAATTTSSTLEIVHSAPRVTGVTATVGSQDVQVTWQAASSGLTYNVYRVGAGGVALTLAAAGQTAAAFTDSALPGNLSAGYVVTALDGLGNESPYSATAWILTPAAWNGAVPSGTFLTPNGDAVLDGAVPVAVKVDAAGGVAALNLAFAPSGSDAWTTAGPFGPAEPSDFNAGTVAPGGAGNVWAATINTTGLASGKYDLRLTVIDSHGVRTQVMGSMAIGAAASRGPPTPGFEVNPSAAADGVHLAWTGAAGSSFQVRRATASSSVFTTLALVNGSHFVDHTAIPGLTYAYQVIRLQPAIAFTAIAYATAVSAFDSGGAVVSGDGGLRVTLTGSLASRVNLTVTPDTSAPALASGLSAAGAAYEIDATSLATGQAVHLLDQNATLRFRLPSGLTAAQAAHLYVFHWNPISAGWVREPTTVDFAHQVAVATVGHFSLFVIALDPLGTTADLEPSLSSANVATGPVTITLSNNDTTHTSTIQYAIDAPAFVDIAASSGARRGLNGDDFIDQSIPLGFSFPIYGGTYTSINMSVNGWLSPTDSSTRFVFPAQPNTVLDNFVMPFARDLFLPVSSTMWTKTVTDSTGTRFIAEWSNASDCCAAGNPQSTFEAILWSSGIVDFAYQSVAASGVPTTIGFSQGDAIHASSWAGIGVPAAGSVQRWTPNSLTGNYDSSVPTLIYTAYTAPLTVSNEGPHALYFRSIAGDGTVEPSQVVNFSIDSRGTVAGILNDNATSPNPFAGVRVGTKDVSGLWDQYTYTAADGSYSLSLAPGIYTIYAGTPPSGYTAAPPVMVTVVTAATATANLVYRRFGHIKALLVDDAGAGVAGVPVVAFYGPCCTAQSVQVTSGIGGAISIEVISGYKYTLQTAPFAGYAKLGYTDGGAVDVNFVVGDFTTHDLTATPLKTRRAGSITGLVEDDRSPAQAVAGAQLIVRDLQWYVYGGNNWTRAPELDYTALSQADGSYSIRANQLSASIEPQPTDGYTPPANLGPIAVTPGGTTAAPSPIVYLRDAPLSGSISSDTGSLPADVTVNFSGSDSNGRTYRGSATVAGGVGAFSLLVPVNATVTVSIVGAPLGFSTYTPVQHTVYVSPGAVVTGMDFVFHSDATISGSVLTDSGAGPGIRIHLHAVGVDSNGSSHQICTTSDTATDPAYCYADLTTGAYSFFAPAGTVTVYADTDPSGGGVYAQPGPVGQSCDGEWTNRCDGRAVTVAAGQLVSGVDFVMHSLVHVHGTLVVNGAPPMTTFYEELDPVDMWGRCYAGCYFHAYVTVAAPVFDFLIAPGYSYYYSSYNGLWGSSPYDGAELFTPAITGLPHLVNSWTSGPATVIVRALDAAGHQLTCPYAGLGTDACRLKVTDPQSNSFIDYVSSYTGYWSNRYTQLEAGTYTVQMPDTFNTLVLASGVDTQTFSVASGAVREVDFIYAPPLAVTGHLVDDATPTPNQLSGLTITATDGSSQVAASATSGADGSYQLRLQPGTFTIRAAALAYHVLPAVQTVTVTAGAVVSGINFSYITIPVAVTGRSVDDTALPVAGVVITATDGSGAVADSATTAADGSYSLRLLPGSYTVSAATLPAHTTSAPQTAVVVAGVVSGGVNFTLTTNTVSLTGRLGDDSSPAQPLAGVVVTATDDTARRPADR